MFSVLTFFKELTNQDIHWFIGAGAEREVPAKHLLIEEGKQPDSLYIVLKGLIGISVASMEGNYLARLGPGEFLGEMSFLDGKPASASVSTIENSLLLEIPRLRLKDKMESDALFSSRLYRAFAMLGFSRLRHSLDHMANLVLGQEAAKGNRKWEEIESRLDRLKDQLVSADKAAIYHHESVPPEQADALVHEIKGFIQLLNQTLTDASEHTQNELGNRVQRELLPYLLMSEIGERIFAKPRGYAGDFLTLDKIYANQAWGTGRLGPVIDRALREQPALQAIRNRRQLMQEEIGKTLEAVSERPALITSLASGPATELFSVFESLSDQRQLKATCIDIDSEALSFVREKRNRLELRSQIELFNGNLVYLATGRQSLEQQPQDLIYSLGLIDAFDDKFVLLLLDYVYAQLARDGRVILTNIHPDNPDKAWMEHIFEWPLIHRSEAELNRLFEQSRFAIPCTEFRYEPEKVHLFAECIKV
ncbi:MAG: cyclic nucleotide-binding domain-containing protein [Candidatus Sericytochromatia bacterium]